jgi:DNA mismatch endonuclease, patch repair protein
VTRSEIMRRNVGDELGPEMTMLGLLVFLGLDRQADRNNDGLPGSPDFAFWNGRLAVFVHGCYWHGCSKCWRLPWTNTAFWAEKVVANWRRDLRARRKLAKMGWSTMVVWEHQLKGDKCMIQAHRVKRRLQVLRSRRRLRKVTRSSQR